MILKGIITSVVAVALAATMAYASDTATAGNIETTDPQPAATASAISYTPEIHGVVRTRWEGEFGNGLDFQQRFQVRNARLTVGGYVLPSVNYFIQIDACERGKMKILDAWGQWSFASSWKIRAGQFRVPYAVDCFRGPGGYIFANRSFMAKDMMNMREVGAKIGYYGTRLPLTIEAGVFNSAAMSDHNVWQRAMNYAAKASWKLGNVSLSASYISAEPDSVRMNLADGAVTYNNGRWIVEGEYQYQHYTHKHYKNVHGWNLFASYSLPLRHRTFNSLSFQARYDGMTDHSDGTRDSDGNLSTDDPSRQRVTVGSTLEFIKKPVRAAIRLNFEKYIYANNVSVPRGDSDKIVAEFVIKF